MSKLLFFIEIVFFLITSCVLNKKNERELVVNNWIGREIELLESTDSFKFDGKTKIVARVNGNCFPCISRLKNWQQFIEIINERCQDCNIEYYFYVVSSDTSSFNKINELQIHFEYPIIFDSLDYFNKMNNLPDNNIYHTMLLDSLNKVVLIGTPLFNNVLQELYIDEIIKISSSQK